jgi:DNA-directed RNA polymerase specialized sigma24 family protein
MTIGEALRALAPPVDDTDHERRQACAVVYEELHRMAPAIVRNVGICQDIASRAFLNLMAAGGRGALDTVGETDAAARSYMATAIRNAFISYHRLKATRYERTSSSDEKTPEAPDSSMRPDLQLEAAELAVQLRRAEAFLLEVVVPTLFTRIRKPHGESFVAAVGQLLEIARGNVTVVDIVERVHGVVSTQTRNVVDQQHKRARDRLADWLSDELPASGVDDGLAMGVRTLLERLRRR